MRAAVMESFGEPLLVQNVPDPACPADGALVRVEACGFCRSDWHVWLGHWPDLEFPVIMGHELQILGSHGMPLSSYGKLLDLVTAGKLDPKRLVARTVALDATPAVLESMENFKTAGFVVIDSYEANEPASA